VQALQVETLVALAAEHGGAAQVLIHAGTFVNEGSEVIRFHHRGRLEREVEERLERCCVIDRERTGFQDFEFAIHQLVEVAVRALSPGINDPFTAMTCADYLGSAYARIGERTLPANVVRDDEGEVRVVLPLIAFEDVLGAGFDQLRQSARRSFAVSIRLLDVLERLLPHLADPAQREAAAAQARAIAAGAEELATEPRDRRCLRDRTRIFEDVLTVESSRED
jgi:uncharacterized membrane protein